MASSHLNTDLRRLEAENEVATAVARRGPSWSTALGRVGLASVGAIALVAVCRGSGSAPPAGFLDKDNEIFKAALANAPAFDPGARLPREDRIQITPPPEPSAVPPPPAAPHGPQAFVVPPPPVNITIPAEDDAEERRLAEEERRRREAEERRYWERLRSNMLTYDSNANGPGGTGSIGPDGRLTLDASDEADANRRFASKVGGQGVEVAVATKNRRIDALVAQGTMIKGVLETAIQSDLPGQVRAIVSEDVWSFDGRRILIPSGTRLIGEYRSGLSRGQTRILIVWTRMLRSDGVSAMLGSYGTDSLGRSGLSGTIDNHYLERFGSAILLSIVGGASSYVAGLGGDSYGSSYGFGRGADDTRRAEDIARTTLSQTFSDLANTALRDSINIPPTIHVDQGARIMVFVRKDVDFSSLYPDPVRQALRELRHERALRPASTGPRISK